MFKSFLLKWQLRTAPTLLDKIIENQDTITLYNEALSGAILYEWPLEDVADEMLRYADSNLRATQRLMRILYKARHCKDPILHRQGEIIERSYQDQCQKFGAENQRISHDTHAIRREQIDEILLKLAEIRHSIPPAPP